MSEASHLANTLQQCARAGVYHLPAGGTEAIERAAAGLGFAVVRADLTNCNDKADFLRRIAGALHFPDWFGHNWDALADCLRDLSWLPADGYVIVLEHADRLRVAAEGDFTTALEILEETARDWAEEDVPMWIFVGLTANGIAHLHSL
ncbi:barstar family protein [Aromatoleum diolicum]|uniref:Barstar (barnase inhibitor) domain-containing protein n=1 Tax=Aromatoleum diolicum TaxID=75796 RepID=A0ABX1QFS2_9RHOO|nr:barstar family protein [Aromatoleum diolicum]NMG76347.1 hypothetical protein [Aromatoleum diolicum]